MSDSINVKIKLPTLKNICPYCLGAGKLKAMQRAMYIGGGSTRVQDTKVKCSHCNGKGFVSD